MSVCYSKSVEVITCCIYFCTFPGKSTYDWMLKASDNLEVKLVDLCLYATLFYVFNMYNLVLYFYKKKYKKRNMLNEEYAEESRVWRVPQKDFLCVLVYVIACSILCCWKQYAVFRLLN